MERTEQEQRMEGRSRQYWYGAEGDSSAPTFQLRSKRALVVMSCALGVMAIVLVIAPLDMHIYNHASMRSLPSRDLSAGRFVVSETATLLSKSAAEVRLQRLQRLLALSSVTSAAQHELARDASVLKSITSQEDWGFSSKSDDTSDRGPAGSIIAQATNVYEGASKLAGDSNIKMGLALSGQDGVSSNAELSAADDISSASIGTKSKPFAQDKGWSVAKEKSDMDAFYDSLNHNAAVKEAKMRKQRAANAAFRATVQKAHAELREIEESTAHKAADPIGTKTAASKAAQLQPAAAKAEAIHTAIAAEPKPVVAARHAGKGPKMSSEASRQKITTYFDDLVQKAKARADLEHPAEKNPSLSAHAARQGISSYFDSLESKEQALLDKLMDAKKTQVCS
jgi:hypothetical protein